MLFNGRNEAIKAGDDFCSMILEAKRQLKDKREKMLNETGNKERNMNEQIFKH